MRNAKYYFKLQLGWGKEGRKEGNEALGINEVISLLFLWGNKPEVGVLWAGCTQLRSDFSI